MIFNYELLRVLRSAKYTQKEFSKIIGVSLRTYVTYEKGDGRMPLNCLLSIAQELKMDVRSFFAPMNAEELSKYAVESKNYVELYKEMKETQKKLDYVYSYISRLELKESMDVLIDSIREKDGYADLPQGSKDLLEKVFSMPLANKDQK